MRRGTKIVGMVILLGTVVGGGSLYLAQQGAFVQPREPTMKTMIDGSYRVYSAQKMSDSRLRTRGEPIYWIVAAPMAKSTMGGRDVLKETGQVSLYYIERRRVQDPTRSFPDPLAITDQWKRIDVAGQKARIVAAQAMYVPRKEDLQPALR